MIQALELTQNPSGISPLSAELVAATAEETTVKLKMHELDIDFSTAQTNHTIPILGLMAGTSNEIEVQFTSISGESETRLLTIETEPLPDWLPDITIQRADSSKMEPGWHMAEFSYGNQGTFQTTPFAFDNEGAVRWYLDLTALGGLKAPIEQLQNGNLLVGGRTAMFEYDFLGRQVNAWPMPGYRQHHEAIELPNGNLVAAVTKVGTVGTPASGEEITLTLDHMIEIDRSTAEVLTEWNMTEVLDIDRGDQHAGGSDWFHMNGLAYDESDHSLVVSGYYQGVAKVNWTNELQWIMAPHKGWGQAGSTGEGFETTDYLLTPVDSNGQPYTTEVQQGLVEGDGFEWNWGQHAPLVMPSGQVLLYDNGLKRHFGTYSPEYSRAVAFEIDSVNREVSQAWTYGPEAHGQPFYSSAISDVDLMPTTQNLLICPGKTLDLTASFMEVTYPEKELVFEALLEFKPQNTSQNGWGWRDIVYRCERINYYGPQTR